MKHFEACIGNQWMAWDANDTTKISRRGEEVIINQMITKDEKTFPLKTVINLDLIPAYASN